MDLSYSWEKFHHATLTLASGQGSLRQRLADAANRHLRDLEPYLPGEFHVAYRTIMAALTPKERNQTSGAALDDVQAAEVAQNIVRLYDKLTRADAVGEHREATQPSSATIAN